MAAIGELLGCALKPFGLLYRLVICILLLASASLASCQDEAITAANKTANGIPLEAAFVHNWAAALAVVALQTNSGSESGAIATVDTIEDLTIQAINATANGMPHAAAERVLDDAGINVSPNKPPFNLTAELQDLAAGDVPAAAAGVLGRVNSNATQFLNGLVVVTDPEVFADSSAKLQAAALGAIVAATGLSYTPCVASAGPAGAVLYAEAISLAPQLIEASAVGAAIVAVGIDIAPTLISIGGVDKGAVVIGLAVTPTLIEIAPTIESNISVGIDLSGSPNPRIGTFNVSVPPEKSPQPPQPPWPFPPDPPPLSKPPQPPQVPMPSLPPLPPQPPKPQANGEPP